VSPERVEPSFLSQDGRSPRRDEASGSEVCERRTLTLGTGVGSMVDATYEIQVAGAVLEQDLRDLGVIWAR
jgi:hypothetical protein